LRADKLGQLFLVFITLARILAGSVAFGLGDLVPGGRLWGLADYRVCSCKIRRVLNALLGTPDKPFGKGTGKAPFRLGLGPPIVGVGRQGGAWLLWAAGEKALAPAWCFSR